MLKVHIHLGRVANVSIPVVFALKCKLNFQFQISNTADFSIYKNDRGIPDYIKVNVDYKKYDDKWILSSVNTEQKKNIIVAKNIVTYTCLRTLQLEQPKIKKSAGTNNNFFISLSFCCCFSS